MVTYILHCYTKNRNPHNSKTILFERTETFRADWTPYVQARLVRKAIDDGFFVRSVTVVKGEAAS